MEPVRAGWTSLRAPGINKSRTVYLKDGRAYTQRWCNPTSWNVPEEDIAGRGPLDDTLRLLVLERLDGTKLAVVGDFSCHNTGGINEKRIHDDLMGVAMEVVETVEGSNCVALCTPGTQGDHDPTAFVRLGDTRDLPLARRLGRRLGGYMLAGAASVKMHDRFDVCTGNVRTEVRVREDFAERSRIWRSPEVDGYVKNKKAPAEVSAIIIGGYALVGVPCEFFTQPGRMIRDHSPFEITSVAGLTNGFLFYVAERDAFSEGSMIYGVDKDGAAMAVPGSAEILARAGIAALREAMSKSPGRGRAS